MYAIRSQAFITQIRSGPGRCCGRVGPFNEDEIGKLREEFCSNIKGATKGAGPSEYYLKKVLKPGEIRYNEFVFFAHNTKDVFDHYWEATENMITQCARGGHAQGSWEDHSEMYGMTLGDTRALRRKRFAVEL